MMLHLGDIVSNEYAVMIQTRETATTTQLVSGELPTLGCRLFSGFLTRNEARMKKGGKKNASPEMIAIRPTRQCSGERRGRVRAGGRV